MTLSKLISHIPFVRFVARKFWKLHNGLIFEEVEQQIRTHTGSTVTTGPFAGMKYPPLSHGTIHASTTPKLLGIYEQELYPAIENLLTQGQYTRTIVIGAAEGYYAVGLALRQPNMQVVAFEADLKLQSDLRSVADLNLVLDRIEIKGFCDPASLSLLPKAQRTLIICDCEGGEVDLITHDILSHLGPTDLVIECHDMIVPKCTEIIISNLSQSHSYEVISSSERTLSDIPPSLLGSLPQSSEEVEWAIREHRHYRMNWIVAKSLS